MGEKTSVLILGATGYIGGSTLHELLNSTDKRYVISALVRKPEQIERLKDVGVEGILFKDLDDLDTIRKVAAQHDIVIAAASARHAGCAKACIEGLGQRRRETGREVHYVHTSGASMLGDWPETGERIDTNFHSDVDEDIYELEKNFPEDYSPVRKVNQLVVHTGEKELVKTYIVPPPLIFGRGTGLFTEGSGQVHMLIQLALQKHQAVKIGSGAGIWSRVHISDLSKLFSLLISNIRSGKQLPHSKFGYYFAENGSQTWDSIARAIGRAGKEAGVFESAHVSGIELREVADVFYGGDLRDAESVLASNARIKADRARQVLDWRPEFGEKDFEQEVKDVFVIMNQA